MSGLQRKSNQKCAYCLDPFIFDLYKESDITGYHIYCPQCTKYFKKKALIARKSNVLEPMYLVNNYNLDETDEEYIERELKLK